MASVTCRSCGKRYDYSKHDCCPDCGAYNRPPRREQVNADGTVRHLTDADYAERKSAELDKVCFEEKECWEDEARPMSSARRRDREEYSAGNRKKARVITMVFAVWVIGMAAAIVFGVLNEIRGRELRPEYPPDPVGPADEIPAPAEGTGYWDFTAQDGSTFRLLDWRQEDDAIEVELEVEFTDSEHEFYATLECVAENGSEVTLEEFEDASDETIVLRFFTDGRKLTPRGFFLKECDWDAEEEIVSTWWIGLTARR